MFGRDQWGGTFEITGDSATDIDDRSRHHLSGPDRHAHTRTLLRRSRSVGGATHGGDPTNQLPCALRVYSPVDSHTCQTPWSVLQDGPNGEPTGRCRERADAEARQGRTLPATIKAKASPQA